MGRGLYRSARIEETATDYSKVGIGMRRRQSVIVGDGQRVVVRAGDMKMLAIKMLSCILSYRLFVL